MARGRLALGQVLSWTTETAWPEVAWTFSDLADGRPIELVWRPGEPGLFWTAEPAAPERPPRCRLHRAPALAEAVGDRFEPRDRALIVALADAAPGPWPVWFGGRHAAAGDAAKLYVCVDRKSLDLAEPRLSRVMPALCGGDLPRLLGFHTEGSIEFYWRRNGADFGDLYRLSRIGGLADAVKRLDSALRDWTGFGIDAPERGGIVYTLKLSSDDRPIAVAAFLRAASIAGAGVVRHRLLDSAAQKIQHWPNSGSRTTCVPCS